VEIALHDAGCIVMLPVAVRRSCPKPKTDKLHEGGMPPMLPIQIRDVKIEPSL
jgi:hypothetical protein